MTMSSFTWLIDGFSPNHLTKQIQSPVFKAENLKETTWFLMLTPESHGDYFAYSLVRNESEVEEIDTIEIDFDMEIVVEDRKVDVKAHTVNKMFKKGDSYLWGSFRYGSSAAKLMIRCHMFSCLQNEISVSVVTIHSKFGHLSWSPSCISDTTFFCGEGATEFAVSLKNVNDKVSLMISKIDNGKQFSYYFMCRIVARDKKNWRYSGEIGNMRDSFSYNQTFELPLGLDRNQITRSDIYFIDIYFACSALVGRMCFMSQEKSDCMCRINRPIETGSMTSSEAIDTLRNDLELLHTKKIQTEEKLKVGTEDFHDHKVILSTRSPVDSAMFNQDVAESQTRDIDITDVQEKTLDVFLKYLFTGSCGQLDCELAFNLMLMAEKYQVYSLKKDCSPYLIPNLPENNVLNNLNEYAMDYVESDRIYFSISSKGPVKNNDSLAAETLRKLSKDNNTTAIEKTDLIVSTRPSSIPAASINLGLPSASKHSTNVRNLHQQQKVQQTVTKKTVSQQAVNIQGQEPPTASNLEGMNPQRQKQVLGEFLFCIIHEWYPHFAGKITGMLLEMDNSELLDLLEDRKSLKALAEEAIRVLKDYEKSKTIRI